MEWSISVIGLTSGEMGWGSFVIGLTSEGMVYLGWDQWGGVTFRVDDC
jgi:hypothetical protein